MSHRVRFGPFCADMQLEELRKDGMRLRLPGQSFHVLKMLLERPGDLVTREQLQKALWPSDTFVDFDHGLNAAVNRLRDALGDSADDPRYIETLPRRGYRFVGVIERTSSETKSEDAAGAASAPSVGSPPASGEAFASRPFFARNRIVALALSGAVCLAALVLTFRHWKRGADAPLPHVVQLTALGFVNYAVLSPDGTRLAFEWNGAQTPSLEGVGLYVKDIGGEKVQRLTDSKSRLLSPAWSPDGLQLAFHRLGKDGSSGIYIIPSHGGAEKKLYSTHASIGRSLGIAWSTDGRNIAFVDAPFSGGHQALNLLSTDTLQAEQIDHNDRCQDEAGPAFSHNGKYLAYECFPTSSDFAIAIVSAVGASAHLIKEFKGYVEGLAWTGDDKRLLFIQTLLGEGRSHIRELTIADGSVRDLPFSTHAEGLSISSGGDRLVFHVESAGTDKIWRGDLSRPQDPPVELISTTRDQLMPQYSPDGTHLVFASDRTGSWEIWMSDAAGDNLVQLTHLGQFSGSPSWSPDGKKIVFDSRTSMKDGSLHADLYVMDLTEKMTRKLNIGTGEASVPSWSHDGKWIYFIGGGSAGGDRVYRVHSEGGQATAVSSARGWGPKESLDGRYVYFASSAGTSLLRASLDPIGTESPVEGIPSLSSAANWTIVRDGIYFFPGGDFTTLSFFDFASKQVRQILKGQLVFYGLSVSPDQRYITYAKHELPKRDVMLVDNFR